MRLLLKNLIMVNGIRLAISSYPAAVGLITYNHTAPPVRRAGIHPYITTDETGNIN